MKMKKRLLSVLLSLVLVLGLMPGMSLTAYAEDYPLWVGGTRVTSTNLSGKGWSYAADTNTLTLNGVDITTGYEYLPQSNCFSGICYGGTGKLEIVLASGSDNKIGVNGPLTDGVGPIQGTTVFSGSGSLTVKGSNFGIMGNSVEVKEGKINVSSSSLYGIGAYSSITFTGGEVNASGSTGVYATKEITIGENASLIATGTQSALSGTVKNAAAGTGWTNTEGTAGEAAIAISTTGQNLGSFKKVQFQANVPVTSVTLNPPAAQTIDVGEKVSFTATVAPDNATNKKVKWSTNNSNVVLYSDQDCTTAVGTDASDTLKVYAKGESVGSTTVTCTATNGTDDTSDDYSASCNVTVDPVIYEVTYRVVNGTWSDGGTYYMAVFVPSGSNPTNVPTGMKPSSGYTGGAWDTDPTNAIITEDKTFTYTFTAKQAATVTKAPEAKSLTYNGSAQELVTAGVADGGEMQYAIGSDTTTAPTTDWRTSIPAKTDAGTYYVWYKVVGDANHNDIAPQCISVMISQTESEKQTEMQDTTPSGGGGGSLPQTADPTPAPTTTPSETVEQPTTTEPAITQDAFTGVSETIAPSTDGTAVVTSVAGTVGNTLRITGTVNQGGTNYPVSSFATESFRDVDVKNIFIDLKTSGNTQTVTFQPRTFKGSEAKKLTLRLSSSGQVKFTNGALSGSKIKKVVVSGLKKKEFKKVEKKLRKSGYKGKIVKK